MNVAANWLQQTRRTYFGNAAAQRDFRVQLRGNRSMLLFGTYLAILIGVGYFKYASIADNASMSVVQAQRELRDFYTLIVMLLGGVVSVVTPALAATAIVTERQRRSLDLVFSAPVAPRYYLVGKTIAVYRYIWMMLILSLPVTAACVVLGGASWSDVLTVYGLLSIHGLLFAAIGLMISTVAPKPVSAIVWTYAAVLGYLVFSGSAAGSGYAMSRMWMGRGGGSTEAPFTIGLNPFTALYTVNTTTTVFGVAVPNAIVASLAILVAVRLCLLGAGSVLSDGRETANLRIHWLVVTAVAAYGVGHFLGASPIFGGGSSVPGVDRNSLAMGIGLFWTLTPLVLIVPNLSVFGTDGALRQRSNGAFAFRRTLDGTPAGALPYLTLLIGLAVLGVYVGGATGSGVPITAITKSIWGSRSASTSVGGAPGLAYFAYALFAYGFWSFFWSVGRLASSFSGGLRAARTVVITAMIVIVALPLPFISVFTQGESERMKDPIFDLSILSPVTGIGTQGLGLVLFYGTALLAATFFVYDYSERRRKRRGGVVVA